MVITVVSVYRISLHIENTVSERNPLCCRSPKNVYCHCPYPYLHATDRFCQPWRVGESFVIVTQFPSRIIMIHTGSSIRFATTSFYLRDFLSKFLGITMNQFRYTQFFAAPTLH